MLNAFIFTYSCRMLSFSLSFVSTDWLMDGWIDEWTDAGSHRDSRVQLKILSSLYTSLISLLVLFFRFFLLWNVVGIIAEHYNIFWQIISITFLTRYQGWQIKKPKNRKNQVFSRFFQGFFKRFLKKPGFFKILVKSLENMTNHWQSLENTTNPWQKRI